MAFWRVIVYAVLDEADEGSHGGRAARGGAVQAAAQFVLDTSLPKNPYGGTYNLTGGPPPQFRNGSYGMQNVSGGTVTLSGEVVFKYKWQGPAGSAPPQAVAHITSSASWHYGEGGSASDGISADDYHFTPATANTGPGGYANGEKWEVKDVGSDGTFEVKLSPSTSAPGVCSVSLRVEAYVATLGVTGTTLVGSTLNALVGQRQTGSVSVSGLVAKNHTWSVGGAVQPFKLVQTTAGQDGQSSRRPFVTSFSINKSFSTTNMFCPSSDGVYVPLLTKGWSWIFSASKDANGVWGSYSGGVTFTTGPGSTYDLSSCEWDKTYFNSMSIYPYTNN